jgi:hypothetical protein
MHNYISQDLVLQQLNIHGVKLRTCEPNRTKMAQRIATAIGVLPQRTWKRKMGTRGAHRRGGLAKAKSNHHEGCGLVPRR